MMGMTLGNHIRHEEIRKKPKQDIINRIGIKKLSWVDMYPDQTSPDGLNISPNRDAGVTKKKRLSIKIRLNEIKETTGRNWH